MAAATSGVAAGEAVSGVSSGAVLTSQRQRRFFRSASRATLMAKAPSQRLIPVAQLVYRASARMNTS
ncbi:MAG: hypothetical protein R3B13_11860 [Polyangiaceae bacterium]